MPSFFDRSTSGEFLARLDRLTRDSQPEWGTMSVAQMLAHTSKPFETVYDPEYERQYPKPKGLTKLILRLIAKPYVVGTTPYRKNGKTAAAFLVTDERDFETERKKLKGFIKRVADEGAAAFEGRESHSFGKLKAKEWSTLFYKHTDHHLRQFGV